MLEKLVSLTDVRGALNNLVFTIDSFFIGVPQGPIQVPLLFSLNLLLQLLFLIFLYQNGAVLL